MKGSQTPRRNPEDPKPSPSAEVATATRRNEETRMGREGGSQVPRTDSGRDLVPQPEEEKGTKRCFYLW